MQTSAPRQTCVKSTAAQPDLPLVVKTERVNCYQDASVSQQGIYISFSEMSKALQPLGIRAEVAKGGAIEFHYGPLGGRLVGELYPIFKRGDEPYLSLVDLLQMTMSGFPVPVKVQNADSPVFSVGQVGSFALTGEAEGDAPRVYQMVAQSAGYNVFDFSSQGQFFGYDFVDASAPPRTIATGLSAGEVVAAYHWQSSALTPREGVPVHVNRVALSLGVTDAQGNVRLPLPEGARFVTAQGKAPGNDVLLLRLTNTPFNNLKSGIFLPRSAQ